jgi:alkylated DNA repair dioxygenase AlkB
MIQQPEILAIPDAEVLYYPSLFGTSESVDFFQDLTLSIAWEQREIKVPGKIVPLPRLTAWYGDPGKTYRYSGMTHNPHSWTPALTTIKERIEAAADAQFNSALLNLYRNEQDSVSWHSDDEPELGENPVIASVSLGAARMFQFKHKHESKLRLTIELTSGSLLLMRGTTQKFWKHRIPKSKEPCGARINLTFRIIQ